MRPCEQCGTELAPTLLSCPSCHRLVHAHVLTRLAADARQAERAGEFSRALAAWRQALELLPTGSHQHASVTATIAGLSQRLSAQATQPARADRAEGKSSGTGKKAAGVGALAAVAWKFKALVVLLLTKAKLLILGLTKIGTLLSMVLSLGVYWAAWGWKFALGLVVSIYIHEMGHVAALRRYGIKAHAPMFIPGVGAFVQMTQRPIDPREDARVGLAGPWWGLATALAATSVFAMTRAQFWLAIAKLGGWLTLFNLLPIWQLDGSRAFEALSRPERWVVASTLAIVWLVAKEGLLVLLILVAMLRALGGRAPAQGDRVALLQYLMLMVVSTALCLLHVPMP